jgi:group I intron endonuclease
LSAANLGKNLSATTRAKMSAAQKGENNHFYGKSHSAAALEKISKAVDVINTVTGESKSYGSGKEAAVALSCNASTVSRCLKNGKLLKGIYKITKTDNI